jgi:putative membrane protein
MKLTLVLATTCALLSFPAFGQTPTTSTGSRTGGTISSQDVVNRVVMADMFDIKLAQMAEQKGDNTDKTFARDEMPVHTKATNDLKGLVTSGKVKDANIPTALDNEYQQKIDALQKLSGQQFDNAFRNNEVQSHRQEIALVEQYSNSGNNGDLKNWASTNLPILRSHLDKAEKLS